MKYIGSKERIVEQLLYPMIKKRRRKQYFVDLFCGGCNVCERVRNPRIANDIDEELIEMFIRLSEGWQPPMFVSEFDYFNIKNNKSRYPPYLLAFVAYGCSFGAKKWGSYAKGFDNYGNERNYARESYYHLTRQIKKLHSVEWYAGDYRDVTLPENSIVYCDIPYKDTYKYHDIEFDYDYFWHWAKIQSFRGHEVFVSSYQAPSRFVCIREMEIVRHINRQADEPRIERLFRYAR